MTQVHPNNANNAAVDVESGKKPATLREVLTVWRKSLLFNGNGFTVFDAKGNLVFRVDNYASHNKGHILLMDAIGNPLLTIRKKKLCLGEQWQIYDGEETTKPLFSVKKHVNHLLDFSHSKSLAHITCQDSYENSASSSPFEVEGSYIHRCCTFYDDKGRPVAEIKRKEPTKNGSYGLDVFKLVVEKGFDVTMAMAFVIVLEQMFGGATGYSSSLLLQHLIKCT